MKEKEPREETTSQKLRRIYADESGRIHDMDYENLNDAIHRGTYEEVVELIDFLAERIDEETQT